MKQRTQWSSIVALLISFAVILSYSFFGGNAEAKSKSSKYSKQDQYSRLYDDYVFYLKRQNPKTTKASHAEFNGLLQSSNIFFKDSLAENAGGRLRMGNDQTRIRNLVNKVYGKLSDSQLKQMAWWMLAEHNIKSELFPKTNKIALASAPINPAEMNELSKYNEKLSADRARIRQHMYAAGNVDAPDEPQEGNTPGAPAGSAMNFLACFAASQGGGSAGPGLAGPGGDVDPSPQGSVSIIDHTPMPGGGNTLGASGPGSITDEFSPDCTTFNEAAAGAGGYAGTADDDENVSGSVSTTSYIEDPTTEGSANDVKITVTQYTNGEIGISSQTAPPGGEYQDSTDWLIEEFSSGITPTDATGVFEVINAMLRQGYYINGEQKFREKIARMKERFHNPRHDAASATNGCPGAEQTFLSCSGMNDGDDPCDAYNALTSGGGAGDEGIMGGSSPECADGPLIPLFVEGFGFTDVDPRDMPQAMQRIRTMHQTRRKPMR